MPACLATQSCMTLRDPLDCSPPGSSVHEITQARIPEWVAMPSSRESSWPRNRTRISCVFCIVDGFFSLWAIKEAPSPVHHLFKCQHSLPVNSYYSNVRTGTGNLYNAHYEGLIKTGINWHFNLTCFNNGLIFYTELSELHATFQGGLNYFTTNAHSWQKRI